MMQTSADIGEISAALAKAQAELENVEKGGTNPHFRSKYATLPDVLAEVRPKLAKHGIAVIQMPVNGDGSTIGVATRFTHSSGQWIESEFYVAPTKFDAQGAGSVVTYLRRYALMAMAGVSGDDDDGNAAVRAPVALAESAGPTTLLINSEQRKALMAIADEVGADKERFLNWLGVDSFASIPASQYQKAVAALNSKRTAQVAAK